MTAQMAETLYENGQEYALLTTPLEAMWASRRKRRLRPRFEFWSTGCWRGYVGTWLIEGDRLWLTDLWGYLGGEEAGFADILPGKPNPLLAEWYSGELRVPTGPLILSSRRWPGGKYETEVFITIERGQVTGRRTVHAEANEEPPIADLRTVFGKVDWSASPHALRTGELNGLPADVATALQSVFRVPAVAGLAAALHVPIGVVATALLAKAEGSRDRNAARLARRLFDHAEEDKVMAALQSIKL